MGNHNTHHERLLELIKERVRRSGRSLRELEREMDLGHGTLGNILRGRTELRFRHLEMLAKELGFDPAELLAEAYGQRPPVRPVSYAVPFSREELTQILTEAVRSVLQNPKRLDNPESSEVGG